MKYILLFIIIYWIGQRVLRIFSAVQNDSGNEPSQHNNSNAGSADASSATKGEYVDFEEIE